MKIVNDTYIQDADYASLKTDRKDEEQLKEVFKKVFLEKMFSQMLKSSKAIPGSSEFEKEVYTEQMSEALADKFVESTDIRWEQIMNGLKKNNEEK